MAELFEKLKVEKDQGTASIISEAGSVIHGGLRLPALSQVIHLDARNEGIGRLSVRLERVGGSTASATAVVEFSRGVAGIGERLFRLAGVGPDTLGAVATLIDSLEKPKSLAETVRSFNALDSLVGICLESYLQESVPQARRYGADSIGALLRLCKIGLSPSMIRLRFGRSYDNEAFVDHLPVPLDLVSDRLSFECEPRFARSRAVLEKLCISTFGLSRVQKKTLALRASEWEKAGDPLAAGMSRTAVQEKILGGGGFLEKEALNRAGIWDQWIVRFGSGTRSKGTPG